MGRFINVYTVILAMVALLGFLVCVVGDAGAEGVQGEWQSSYRVTRRSGVQLVNWRYVSDALVKELVPVGYEKLLDPPGRVEWYEDADSEGAVLVRVVDAGSAAQLPHNSSDQGPGKDYSLAGAELTTRTGYNKLGSTGQLRHEWLIPETAYSARAPVSVQMRVRIPSH